MRVSDRVVFQGPAPPPNQPHAIPVCFAFQLTRWQRGICLELITYWYH